MVVARTEGELTAAVAGLLTSEAAWDTAAVGQARRCNAAAAAGPGLGLGLGGGTPPLLRLACAALSHRRGVLANLATTLLGGSIASDGESDSCRHAPAHNVGLIPRGGALLCPLPHFKGDCRAVSPASHAPGVAHPLAVAVRSFMLGPCTRLTLHGGGGGGGGEGEGGEWVAEEDFVEALGGGGWGARGEVAAFQLGLARECSD